MTELGQLAQDFLGRRKSTTSLVADALREAILRGVLKGNQPLLQDEIAAQFGLSRIPVREALRQLEGEGLVVFYPNRGAVVSHLSYEEVREISDIRVALETSAMRLALPHLTKPVLDEAEAILDAIDAEVDVIHHWSERNWEFHSTLYSSANRPLLLRMIKTLHNNVDRYLRLHVSLMNYKEKGQREHRQILAAFREGDAERAAALLEHHISSVAELLQPYLTSPAAGTPQSADGRRRGRVKAAPEADGAAASDSTAAPVLEPTARE